MLSKLFEKRSKLSIDKPYQWPDLFGLFGKKSAGIEVNEWKALQLSTVFACVRLISNTIGMLPLTLHQEINQDKSRIASEKQLNTVLYRMANKYVTAFMFKQVLQAHVLLWGNGYAEITRNNKGEAIELWLLCPWNMKVSAVNGERVYTYKLPDNGGEKVLRGENVFHLPGLSFDGLVGTSVIGVMREEVGLGIALQQFGSKYFENGTNLGGVVEHPNILGDKARVHLKKDLEDSFSGIDNALKMIILEEGMKYQKIGIPAEDAQFIESRKFQIEEVCRYFGVQLHMIQNLDKASFNNIEQQGIEFKTYCIGPWATTWEQEIYRSLLSDKEKKQNYYAKFNVNALMRGDYKTRMEGYRTGIQMGLYSLNEVRKLEDMNPIEDDSGDIHWVNSAMIPIENQLQGGGGDIVEQGQVPDEGEGQV